MDSSGKASVSAALILLLCFFLPWVQVSCGSSTDTVAGIDLAREGHNGLWLIPLLMLVVIVLGLTRALKARGLGSVVSFLAGLVSVYLMNRERMRAGESSGLIAVRLTGWFWLGFGSAVAMIVIAALQLLRRPKPT